MNSLPPLDSKRTALLAATAAEKPATGSVPVVSVEALAANPDINALRGMLDAWFAPFIANASLLVRASLNDAPVKDMHLSYEGVNHTFYVGDRRHSPLFALHDDPAIVLRGVELSRAENGNLLLRVDVKSGTVRRWLADELRIHNVHNGYDPVDQSAEFELEVRGGQARMRAVDFASSRVLGFGEQTAEVVFPDAIRQHNDIKGAGFESIFI